MASVAQTTFFPVNCDHMQTSGAESKFVSSAPLPPPPWHLGSRFVYAFSFSIPAGPSMTLLCVLCEKSGEILLLSLGEFSSGWYQQRRMPQIPGYCGAEKRQLCCCCCCLLKLWSPGSPSRSFAPSLPLRLSLVSVRPDPRQQPVFICFAWNRHAHAQLVLRRLQARPMCPAFIWSCDQVGVLLCQYRVRLWRTLPALPTAKLWYRCSNHYARAHTHSHAMNSHNHKCNCIDIINTKENW